MNILFAGTPEIAVPALTALSKSSHTVVGVLTAPDRRVGRGRQVVPGPVKTRAQELGIPVLQPERLGAAARKAVAELGADLLVCVAYGRIFGPKFLGLFGGGGINLHPSLLPKYRGPAPIPAAILAGETTTGLTIQALSLEMDAGDILLQEEVPLDGSETTGTLTRLAAERGAALLITAVDALADGSAVPRPQAHGEATYTGFISKADGEIDFNLPAKTIERAIRAYQPWPLAFTTFGGQRLNILEAAVVDAATARAVDITARSAPGAPDTTRQPEPGTVVRVDTEQGILVETGDGQLALKKLQLQSRKALSWNSFLNGVNDFVGTVLGD